MRILIRRKLRIIQDPGQFDFVPLKTSTTDLRQLDKRINNLMSQLDIRFACEKAFTAYASHELLTPIAVLRNRFDNIIADEETPDHIAARLVDSQQTLLRLSRIVQMLLCLARIENHQYLKNETISIRSVLLEVLHALDDRIAMKEITMTLEPDTDIVSISANHSLLYTMLVNLIGNAVRYNTDQGHVTIGWGRFGNRPTLTITDSGPGMTPEQIAMLTQYGRPVKATGNGIGLQVIQTISRFHHIGISVDPSTTKGTLITLKFTDIQ
ncbi:sensor histidine kinase [Fibrella forsythiae]|uniref:histidine kinase n=1 Tax=Fibrella forsythiae TaxID=2817061 RepID=A0ABS3JB07_9BACT|nr:HAMP domain-containing sensor histidine kinase [Fibrella forsythiae]MBO0947163.1 HAMP domain-containing histidine kinase [Fibrella forsythiae]